MRDGPSSHLRPIRSQGAEAMSEAIAAEVRTTCRHAAEPIHPGETVKSQIRRAWDALQRPPARSQPGPRAAMPKKPASLCFCLTLEFLQVTLADAAVEVVRVPDEEHLPADEVLRDSSGRTQGASGRKPTMA